MSRIPCPCDPHGVEHISRDSPLEQHKGQCQILQPAEDAAHRTSRINHELRKSNAAHTKLRLHRHSHGPYHSGKALEIGGFTGKEVRKPRNYVPVPESVDLSQAQFIPWVKQVEGIASTGEGPTREPLMH